MSALIYCIYPRHGGTHPSYGFRIPYSFPPMTQWHDDHLTFRRRIPQQAYNNTVSASLPSAILLHADKSWHQNSAHLPFGATYHTWFPSTWARQTLGANINTAFSEHLYNCIHRPKLTKPCSPTYAYPLAIGCHTRPYIQPTTQQWHDHLRVGTKHNPDDAF
jgi:hypothetical protein